LPRCRLFKPAGVPCSSLQELIVSVDEMEAMRLADMDGMYHEQAAAQMNISRQTFGRVVESARRKVAQALCQGLALRIEGGAVEVVTMRRFQCGDCGRLWELPHGAGRPQRCPHCQGTNISRWAADRGCRGGWGRGRGRGRCHRGGAGAMAPGGVVETSGTSGDQGASQ
jgi:LSD1 subclass zinc finger protein